MRPVHRRVLAFVASAASAPFLTYFSLAENPQKVDPPIPEANWVSACASVPLNTGTNLCTFLINEYVKLDNQCGFKFGKAWYKEWPWHWGPVQPWEVIPNKVMQSIPLDSADIQNSTWTLLKMPTLARLMTYGFPSEAQNNYEASVEDPATPNLLPLSFNPLTAPEVMFNDGDSNSGENLSCSDALNATENGKVNFALASAAEKFSSSENSMSSAKLAYGRFESPMAYDRLHFPDTFNFEILNWYETYKRSQATWSYTKPPWPTNVSYVDTLEGAVAYETVKGSLSNELSGSATAGYSVPLGSIEGSLQGNKSVGDTTAANLFYAVVRNKPKFSPLPSKRRHGELVPSCIAGLNQLQRSVGQTSSFQSKFQPS